MSVLKKFDFNICLSGDLTALCIIGVSVIAGCLQGQSLLYGQSDCYKGIFSLIVDLSIANAYMHSHMRII